MWTTTFRVKKAEECAEWRLHRMTRLRQPVGQSSRLSEARRTVTKHNISDMRPVIAVYVTWAILCRVWNPEVVVYSFFGGSKTGDPPVCCRETTVKRLALHVIVYSRFVDLQEHCSAILPHFCCYDFHQTHNARIRCSTRRKPWKTRVDAHVDSIKICL